MVNNNKQRGVVLIVSLVFLIALTSVATVLMINTTSDIRMSGASEEKTTAIQEAVSAVDQVIYKQVNQIGGQNGFSIDINAYPITESVTASDTTAKIEVANPNALEVQCPAIKNGSSMDEFSCNALIIRVTKKYGRKKKQEINVNTGIAQVFIGNQ